MSVGVALAVSKTLPGVEEGFCMLRHRVGAMLANSSSIAVCGTVDGRAAPPAGTDTGPRGQPLQPEPDR